MFQPQSSGIGIDHYDKLSHNLYLKYSEKNYAINFGENLHSANSCGPATKKFCLLVSALTFDSNDPSSNPDEVYILHVKHSLKINKKEAG